MKKISIIVPIYNAVQTIEKCLDSILANNFSDFEVVLVNDGSTDESGQVIVKYSQKYQQKIKIIEQENLGVAVARNNGIIAASGDYVMFVDNDDYVESDYLQKFFEQMEKTGAEAVFGGYKRVTKDKILYRVALKDFKWSKYVVMAPWAKIYQRQFLLKNKINFLSNNIGEDVYFNLQVINFAKNIVMFDYCGYNWFFNECSVSNTRQKTIDDLKVEFLLENCQQKMAKMNIVEKKEVEYYFVRYVVWFLLFAGRSSSFSKTKEKYEKLFAWLKKEFPAFEKNELVSIFGPHGESFKNGFSVWIFMQIHKVKMVPLLLRFYCRDKP